MIRKQIIYDYCIQEVHVDVIYWEKNPHIYNYDHSYFEHHKSKKVRKQTWRYLLSWH